MKIVVLGGSGFIGSHLCDALLAAGHQVLSVDNLLSGSASNLEHLEGHTDFEQVKADVSEALIVPGPVDYVLHFASPASPVDFHRIPIQILKAGSLGTLNALEFAISKGAKLLFASTSEVYGDPLVSPQTEDYWGNVNPVGPRSVYDEAKRFGEALVMAFHRAHGLDTKIARIFNTYGPRMRADDGRAVPNFVSQASAGQDITLYGDGSQTRSFCYVSDLVDGIVRLMQSSQHGPVNLGNPNEVTVADLAALVVELTESKSRIVLHPLPRMTPNSAVPTSRGLNRPWGGSPRCP